MFKFSIRNYHLMLSVPVAGLLIYAYTIHAIWPFILLLAFALTGVIAEIFLDFWWQIFYGQRLWIYNTETFYHKYSSFLNFIPWGIGGLMYFFIGKLILPDFDFSGIGFIFTFVFFLLAFLQKAFFDLLKPSPHFKFHRANFWNLMFFYAPILLALILAVGIYGRKLLMLFVVFGIIATVAEYLFGKACHFFISKKLWNYTYLSCDNGHFTPIAIPLFAFGGFYFLIIANLLGLY